MIRFETINEAGRQLADMLQRENIPFESEAIVFIGALGICVRRLQPLIHDNASDPAVVCVDTTGRYAIPVLSGHIGGANELARQIARITGGKAIITTQSDLKGLWALDTLARDYGWGMIPLSREEMNRAIATFVAERPTALIIECDDRGTRHLVETCPKHVTLFADRAAYENSIKAGVMFDLLIVVSPLVKTPHCDVSTIHYIPRILTLGVGCQRDVSTEAAQAIIDGVRQAGYLPEAIGSVQHCWCATGGISARSNRLDCYGGTQKR